MLQIEKIDIQKINAIADMLETTTKIINSGLDESAISSMYNESTPLWVRTVNNQFCGIINDSNDIKLIISTAKRKAEEGSPILVQQGIEGKTCYLIGYRMSYHFFPVEIFGVEFIPGNYRIPRLLWLPVEFPGKELKSITEKAKEVARNLPLGYYGVLFEFVVNAQGVFLSFIDPFFQPDEGMCQICKEGTGMDLMRIHQTVEKQGIPDVVPTRELGCAIAWIIPHSGIVQSIKNIEKVQSTEGIKQVYIRVHEGDSLTHITDIDSRNKTGYVIAIGPDAFTARNRALSAVSRIQINTRNLLP
ncbi:MAG: hypothetical protein ACP5KS_12705 [Candidatus Hydrogenedens sp.]